MVPYLQKISRAVNKTMARLRSLSAILASPDFFPAQVHHLEKDHLLIWPEVLTIPSTPRTVVELVSLLEVMRPFNPQTG